MIASPCSSVPTCVLGAPLPLPLQDGQTPRFTAADLQPHLATLLQNLFAGFQHPDSAENEYLMRAVTRVIG